MEELATGSAFVTRNGVPANDAITRASSRTAGARNAAVGASAP